jgi:hypothetical protein
MRRAVGAVVFVACLMIVAGALHARPAAEKRLLDEEVHYIDTLQQHRIIPHSSTVRGWTITPAHFLNQQLDTVWLAE